MFSRENVRGWLAIYDLYLEINVIFFMSPTWIGEAESNPLFLRAKSATSNALSTATVLFYRDLDMRRNRPRSHKCEK